MWERIGWTGSATQLEPSTSSKTFGSQAAICEDIGVIFVFVLTSADSGETMTVVGDEHREVSHALGSLAGIRRRCGSLGV